MRVRIASIAFLASMAAHAQEPAGSAATAQPPAMSAQPVQEQAPPASFGTADCNLACQLKKMGFAPGGGSGLAVGRAAQETKQINGLELGIERPSAEQLQREMRIAPFKGLNIQ